MSSISRRSILGYSGTAAAGAVVGTTAPAQQAESAEAADTTATQFGEGTLFSGTTSLGNADYYLEIKFSVSTAEAPSENQISSLEIADLLNDFAATRGWPPITFWGTPPQAKLN
ncbi:twin-arginine translocation signal domain-containing protein [Streptomyces sp. NPDC048254]|uniref:twin-arginine translocation signal domain-containing protein n=1 Tax=Streptomyces sp. NPDC048254 TaxID=3365525 RepID=UPI00371BDFFB